VIDVGAINSEYYLKVNPLTPQTSYRILYHYYSRAMPYKYFAIASKEIKYEMIKKDLILSF
jgi:hypothetical protein